MSFPAKPKAEHERSLRNPYQILAWMEEMARIKAGIEVRLDNDGDNLATLIGKVVEVDEVNQTCTLNLNWKPKREPIQGQKGDFLFAMDEQFYRAEMFLVGRGNYMEYRFSLPIAIEHGDRRASYRYSIEPKERVPVIVAKGLLDECLAISGEVLDLSSGGCRFLIKRAIDPKKEEPVNVNAQLLTQGETLVLVRLPTVGVKEGHGQVAHVGLGPSGVVVGIAFKELNSKDRTALDTFLAQRYRPAVPEFPWKQRAKDALVAITEATKSSREMAAREQRTPCSDDREVLPERKGEGPDETPGTGRHQAQVVLKRGKKVLLIISDDWERAALALAFVADDYLCVYEANCLVRALELQRKSPPDLILVDQTVGHHGALDVLVALRSAGVATAAPVVVLQRKQDVRLTVAAKAGGVKLLVNHPLSYSNDLKPHLEALLGLG